jgi:DNA-binding LacI/PurR family transcriptional regulator
VHYLIELGHRDLGLTFGPDTLPTAAACLQGFGGGRRSMREILALDPRPTAVFSFNNLLAVWALRAPREGDVKVAADLSLVTFVDMDLFPFEDPPITAIAQPAYRWASWRTRFCSRCSRPIRSFSVKWFCRRSSGCVSSAPPPRL